MNSLVSAKQVSFSYPQNHRGLPPITISIGRGEGVLIHGSSGCGKSTLARCLSGMIPHLYHGDFQGMVLINGKSTRDYELWQLSELMGMVFQNPAMQILAETVEEEILFGLENLGMPRSQMVEKLEMTLDQFSLQQFRQRSPLTLSGGEQQKLALASIVARNPQVLILDEPLSMLDTTSAIEFVSAVDHLIDKGISAVICEHRQQFLTGIKKLKTIQLNGNSSIELPITELDTIYPPLASHFDLTVNNLSVIRGNKTILNDLNFHLHSGEIVAVVGRNGAGKTTLFRALMKLLPYNGNIAVNSDNGQEEARFNMIFQNPDTQLFNATVREEILYNIHNPDFSLYKWLIESLNLVRYEDTPPLLLSEGEKRRVALATALMHPLHHGVLLDEPSLGQDGEHKRILMRLLRSLANSGYLVLISTHDLELAAKADQILLLSQNGIEDLGLSKEILANDVAWNKIGLVKPDWMDLG